MGYRLLKSMVGGTFIALGVATIMASGLGSFSMTAAYMSLSDWFNIPFFLTNIIAELIMIAYVTYKGEGIGWSTIISSTYICVMIEVFYNILPQHPCMIFLGLIYYIGLAMTASAELGDSGVNLLMKILVRDTGKSVSFIRTVEECVFLLIGILGIGGRGFVSWMTIVLTFITGPILQYCYKLFKFDPKKAEHEYIFKLNK